MLRKSCVLTLVACSLVTSVVGGFVQTAQTKICNVKPLGHGRDDTPQVLAAIDECGHFGKTVFAAGNYNITQKMEWNLVSSRVELNGIFNFKPDPVFWLDSSNTFRVIFIQSQASWFVITGQDFEIDAGGIGGIQGHGQVWWDYYLNRTRVDGDGRPVSLTVWNATRGVIKDFRIESPPFWANAVSESSDITYDGMFVNATNTNEAVADQNVVFNTDGIDTYRSSRITMRNWDVTCGDDCIAVKGNSSQIHASNFVCRGGTGIAFGSLGQYANLTDIVQDVLIENVHSMRIKAQPIMWNGVYFKSWSNTIHGSPPNGGGAGKGFLRNITARNFVLDQVDTAVHLYQTNLAQPGDAPSMYKFSDMHFINWSGSLSTNKVVDIECSPAVGCNDITFQNFKFTVPDSEPESFICQNAVVQGLSSPCNATGMP